MFNPTFQKHPKLRFPCQQCGIQFTLTSLHFMEGICNNYFGLWQRFDKIVNPFQILKNAICFANITSSSCLLKYCLHAIHIRHNIRSGWNPLKAFRDGRSLRLAGLQSTGLNLDPPSHFANFRFKSVQTSDVKFTLWTGFDFVSEK